MVNFIAEHFFEITTLIVGSFALVIYILQENRKRIDAALLIVVQIDELQERVREIAGYIVDGKLNETAFYESLPLLETNFWNQYKHYFVGKMDRTSFNAINCFYEYVAAIQEQQLLMKTLQKNFFYLTQNILATTETQFLVSSLASCSTQTVQQVSQVLKNTIPTNVSDEEKTTLSELIQKFAEQNRQIDAGQFWFMYRHQQNEFAKAINQNALTSYVPIQIRISLEKILAKYSMLEVVGTPGYRFLKKISQKKC